MVVVELIPHKPKPGMGGLVLTESGRSRIELPFAVFIVVMILVMVFPIFALANRATPIVLGLPFSMFWVVFWIAVEFVALILFYRREYRKGAG